MPKIHVETEPTCRYCRRRSSGKFCGRCGRVLCSSCYAGLKCAQRKCHPKPNGDGVR